MPVFCVVYGCSNRSNRGNKRSFYRVRKCVVHEGGKARNGLKNAGKGDL